jgi:hypothetical protein
MDIWSVDSSANKATGLYGFMDRVRFPTEKRDFVFVIPSRPALGSILPFNQWMLGTVAPRIWWLEYGSNHSSPSSSKETDARHTCSSHVSQEKAEQLGNSAKCCNESK